MAVTFFSFPKLKTLTQKKAKIWLRETAFSHQKKIKNITYNFCTDNELLELNKKFLEHNTYTDIITFDYSQGIYISGEIHISIERVEENARKYCSVFQDELLRVMAHGLLHLCGYNDKTSAQQKKMRTAENKAIRNFHILRD